MFGEHNDFSLEEYLKGLESHHITEEYEDFDYMEDDDDDYDPSVPNFDIP